MLCSQPNTTTASAFLDTKLTDYNSMNAACHKDLVKEFLEAFRAEGIKVGLYFFHHRLAPFGFPALWRYAPSNAQPSGMLQ